MAEHDVTTLDRAVSEPDRAARVRSERQPDADLPVQEAQRSDRKPADPPPPENARKAPRSRRGLFIFGIILLVVACAGLYFWIANRGLASTDDAYTDGFTVSIAPQVAGQVIELAVKDNQFVHKGDVLIRIDPRNFVAQRDQSRANLANAQGQLESARFATEVARKNFPAQLDLAQAQLASAKATLFRATADARRQHAIARSATTQQDVDSADAALLSAQAQVQQAEAQVQQATPVQANIGQTSARESEQSAALQEAQAQLVQAELNVEWSVVRAPQDGWVTKRGVNLGDYVTAGQSLMSLVTPEIWVTANFKENQLAGMRPGQRVDIRVDAFPDLRLEGHVDSVQLGTGSRFTAFPAENATGNFVKIVQRVPVKIVIDRGLDPNRPLPLGVSVTPSVHLE